MEIFEHVLEASPDARDQMIRDETGNDAELAATVRGMLTADAKANDLLDDGIGGLAHLAVEPGHVESTELSLGDRIGDFEIIAELGRGGMGIVYAARDLTLGRVAALKLLPERVTIDSAASERLIAEAQAASALDHQNVATIYQIGETHDGHRFIAMARYEGETLRDRLARGPLASREAFDIETWHRLDHTNSQRIFLVIDEGDLLALHTVRMALGDTLAAFEAIRDSLHFVSARR